MDISRSGTGSPSASNTRAITVARSGLIAGNLPPVVAGRLLPVPGSAVAGGDDVGLDSVLGGVGGIAGGHDVLIEGAPAPLLSRP